MAELADANAKALKLVKLNLFQEAQKTRFESISNCQYRFVAVAVFKSRRSRQKNDLWERSSMVERRHLELKIDIKRRWILNDRSKLAQWKSNCLKSNGMSVRF
jgi:hypothetical protein